MVCLTDQQRKAHHDAHNSDCAAFDTKLKATRDVCEDCRQIDGVCATHQPDYRQMLRELYLSSQPGRWYSGDEHYKTAIAKIFDSGPASAVVSVEPIAHAFRRAYEQDSLCSPRFDDDMATTERKAEAAQMFEQSEAVSDIVQYLADGEKRARASQTAEQIRVGETLAACTDDAARYECLKTHYATPLASDSTIDGVPALRAKYAAQFAAGEPYAQIRATMERDIADRENEVARRDRERRACELELKNLRAGEAGYKKTQQRKKDRLAAGVARFMDQHSQPCSGTACTQRAAPVSTSAGPRECRVCFALAQRARGAAPRTFYCSAACEEKTEARHYEAAHPCVAGAGCAMKTTPEADRKSGGFCDVCDELFGLTSYFCSPACYDKNKQPHEQIHSDQKALLLQKWEADPSLEREWMSKHPQPVAA